MQKGTKQSAKEPGLPPGTLSFVGHRRAETVRIQVVDYDGETADTFQLEQVDDCSNLAGRRANGWIHVSGLHRVDIVERLGRCFQVPPLILEDILNTGHRPKADIWEKGVFVVAKFFAMEPEEETLQMEQVSFILGGNFLISFQESDRPIFKPVRKRLATPGSRLRRCGVDYLLYCLIDLVVDHYFVVVETVGDRIEDLEEALFHGEGEDLLDPIHRIRRQCLFLRKAVVPLRDAVGILRREEGPLGSREIQPYLKDLQDHVFQVLDTLENQREMGTALLDVYLSSMSNRMNEVMKVLTIIATIFIPITFIAGVYGMNFQYMPELKWPWAYPAVWLIMIVVAVLMLLFFRKKRWI
ncbi:magnesium transporter [Desulfacinum hydrothermale DSM 13146]|uniref:Magnesium transport protein CorA n=1 Tax=Desulfacinum hydrothermale DSM 13146 TaxID=1121390 RepID=A0A1W1XKR6_9BACT|nr:magnesium/cobalt transporter CorA [Desulfacinum hydrothermale]SMC24432.1 magnesium transporter [Desulfacinum hydrothermale DSM 13146]